MSDTLGHTPHQSTLHIDIGDVRFIIRASSRADQTYIKSVRRTVLQSTRYWDKLTNVTKVGSNDVERIRRHRKISLHRGSITIIRIVFEFQLYIEMILPYAS